MNIENKVRNVLASVLEVSTFDLKDNLEIGDIDGWDSIRQLMISSILAEEFNITFSEDELFEMTSVAKIVSTTCRLISENE